MALTSRYERTGSRVKSPELADAIGRKPGTVRNQMQQLTGIGLAEGFQGKDGGYRPTRQAFEALGRRRIDDGETVEIAHEHERIDVVIDGIEFTNVHHPKLCRARLSFRESVSRFDVGDPVVVGPIPESRLLVGGRVEARDELTCELLVEVDSIEAPLGSPIEARA